MAVIGKIQKNSILLLVVIGGAMLAFIFADAKSWFNGDNEPTPRATIFGEAIDELELNELEESFVNREAQNYYYQGKEFDDNAKKNAKDMAFNEYVRKEIMNRELNALGILVSAAELNDMVLGEHIHPWIAQERAFQNSLGMFSKDSVANYINYLETEPDGLDTMQYNNWLNTKTAWKNFETELKSARSADKYVTLVKKGLYVNSLEAKNQYNAAQETRQISFVIQKFSEIPLDEFEVTDEEIKAYYDEHKNDKMYEQTDVTAVLDFVEFKVDFTQNDIDDAFEAMEQAKPGFEKADNDIYFMANKSDEQFYSDSTYFSLGSDELSTSGQFVYPMNADEAIQAADSGDVVGPFITPTKVFVAKVKGFKTEEQAWVRHILITTGANRTDAEGKKMADSVVNVINQNNNFVEMVEALSEDPGSIPNGGEYKWFPKGRMVPEFENASFNGAKGKLQVVKTTYGYHIVEVLDRRNSKIPMLAPVIRNIKPSIETKANIEEIAYDFMSKVEDVATDSAFYEVAEADSMTVKSTRMAIKSQYVMGYTDNNAITKLKKFGFAKDAVEGDMSDPILDNGVYKVAIISNIIQEGTPEFEDVKEQMRFPALREKQANHYIELMSGTNNLQEIVAKLPNLRIMTASVNFNVNTIQGGGGNEPKVIGSIFSVSPELRPLLAPIKGTSGVYVIRIDDVKTPAETTDYSGDQISLRVGRQSSADNMVIRALRDKADVKDNRERVEIQGR